MRTILDLCCAAGGAGAGYKQAGFHVVGVDIKPQKRYAGHEFIQADAIEFALKHAHEFDAIHASPPCQFGTIAKNFHAKDSSYNGRHVNLIPAARFALIMSGKPYIIENVPGARRELHSPVMLCGAQFGLKVYRHRFFESNIPLVVPEHVAHDDSTPSVGRGISPKGFVSIAGNGCGGSYPVNGVMLGYTDYCRYAMGIEWMTRDELSQAIPPAYTQFLGAQLMAHLEGIPV